MCAGGLGSISRADNLNSWFYPSKVVKMSSGQYSGWPLQKTARRVSVAIRWPCAWLMQPVAQTTERGSLAVSEGASEETWLFKALKECSSSTFNLRHIVVTMCLVNTRPAGSGCQPTGGVNNLDRKHWSFMSIAMVEIGEKFDIFLAVYFKLNKQFSFIFH